MVRRLTQAGMRPISLAVDVTNYVMLEIGRPIHGYDADKLTGPIRVRRATEGERLTTLDGVDRALSTEDLVVTDDSGIIGLGGVMGGETTEMSATTTSVLVEAAHWDATSMFRTGKRHKLTSEAGKRNERGVDPVVTRAAADRVVELLTTYGGGTADPGVTVVGTPPSQPTIEMSYDLPARVTGMPIDAATTVANLEAVGCVLAKDDTTLTATPPPWRPDLTDPFDLVEEVARIVGYDQVPSVLPRDAAGRGLTREQRLRRRVGRLLAGAGCVEVISFPFVGDAAFDALGLPADDVLRRTVRLANPLSSEDPSYTTTLLPGLLKAAARNLGRGATGVSLFETGTVAFPVDRGPAPIYGVDRRPSDDELATLFEALPEQPLHLAVVLAGERERAGWWGAGREAGWSDAIGIVRRLGTELGVDVEVVSTARAPWHPGRCAQVLVGRRRVRPRRRAAPQGLPGVRAAAAQRGGRGRPRLPDAARPRRDAGTRLLDVPAGEGGRRPRGRRRRHDGRRRGGTARGRGRACSSRSGSSTSSPATRSARGASRSRSPCASGRRTAP